MNHDIPNIPEAEEFSDPIGKCIDTLRNENSDLKEKIQYLERQLSKTRIERDLLLSIVKETR
jgi:cell division septum initiation protein DivIVA